MKIGFYKISQCEVLLLYPLKLNKIKSSFYFDNKEINLRYVPQAILSYLKNFFFNYTTLRNSYYDTIINQVNPIVTLGHDQDGKVLKIKKRFPKKITVMFQYGAIQEIWKRYFNKFWGNKKADYYVVFNKETLRRLKKIKTLKCKYLLYGSLRNNEFVIGKRKKKYDYMFISDYRDIKDSYNLEKENQKYNKKLLRIIADYCEQKEKKILVSLVANRRGKKRNLNFFSYIGFRSREKKYFEDISSVFQFNNQNSYENFSVSKAAICSASTLGFELLSRKQKVYFLESYYSINNKKNKNKSIVDKKEIFFNLQNILKNEKKYQKKKLKSDKKYERYVIYDKDNIKFKKCLKKIISKNEN